MSLEVEALSSCCLNFNGALIHEYHIIELLPSRNTPDGILQTLGSIGCSNCLTVCLCTGYPAKFLSCHFDSRCGHRNIKHSLNTRNECLTAKLLKQGYRFHKVRKAFSKFYRRHYELISKFNVGLKSLLHQVLSEPEFYCDLVYKFKKD